MGTLLGNFIILILVGLVLIWAPQLRTFALSLTAVAVAIVVATKVMIQSATLMMTTEKSKTFHASSR